MKYLQPTEENKTRPFAEYTLPVLAAATLFLTLTACEQKSGGETAENNQANEEVVQNPGYDEKEIAGEVGADQVNWNNVDFNIMQDRYDEVDDKDITVGTNQQVAVYTINEPLLFDQEGPELRPGAEQKLKQIAASINQRYPDAQLRIYGYGEQEGGAGNNKELAEKRAHAVHKWLTTEGKISEGKVSMHTSGENVPGTGNGNNAATTDRKVSIVVNRSASTGNLNTDHGSPNNRESDASNETQGKH